MPASHAGMTRRDWHRRVWRLAGPIILSNLSTPLLGAVDTAVMGHLPKASYIGAVAVGTIIFNFIFWGFGFLRMGTTGFAAQAHGAGHSMELRATLLRSVGLAALLGGLLILLQWPIAAVAFWAMDGSQEVESLAATYYYIRIWSAPASLVNYALLGWLLGTQHAGMALVLQLVLNSTNILLDLVFVLGLGWDIEGVAYATLIAEAFAALLGVILVMRVARRHGGDWNVGVTLRKDRLLALFRVNVDIFIRTLCLVLAFAVFTSQSASEGDIVLAANAILMQLQHFIAYGLDGFAHAAEILAGGAFGARRRREFREAVVVSGTWALIVAAISTVFLLLLGEFFVGLFTDLPEVLAATAVYLPWLVFWPLISVWSYQLDGIFIGATATGPMRNAMVASLAIYLLAIWLLVPAFGNHGLWLALYVLMAARALTLALRYLSLEASVEVPKKMPEGGEQTP